MYISEVNLENFRKYKKLKVNFNPSMNVIVGENNSGKTAIIDAIRIALGTQGNDFYRIEKEDFHVENEIYTNEFKIELLIEGITDQEGAKFLEYISYRENEDENSHIEFLPYIVIRFIAKYDNNKIFYDTYVGDLEENIGVRIPSEIREYLKIVFLKPLRDAENQMVAKKNSRLSQILISFENELLEDNEDNKLVGIMKQANEKIKKITDEIKLIPIGEEKPKSIIELVNGFVALINAGDNSSLTSLKLKDSSLKEILERMSIEFDSKKEGLGIENLLFTAIEFLLLKNANYIGLKTVLIEEIEAHLHPQTQLNLINYLIENYSNKESGQIIMTTHSPNITSKVDIENILMCKNDCVYSLNSDCTKLEKGDYKFLKRFLDVTKANLFFAKALIFVEGDAEAILVPILAKIILKSALETKGISIINVGSTAFLRYSKIFQRKKTDEIIGIKIAIITDLDVKKKKLENGEFEDEETLKQREEAERIRKDKLYSCGNIKTYISPKRTLEYCIALTKYRQKLLESIYEANKEENSNKYPDTDKKIQECKKNAETFFSTYAELNEYQLAEKIYDEELMNGGFNNVSKAITAQILANKIEEEYNNLTNEQKEEYRNSLLEQNGIKYIIDAIKYVGGIDE